MEKKKYLLVWWSDMGDVEELDYDELNEFLYEEVDGGKKLYEDVEEKDLGNGLKSYVAYRSLDRTWVIIEVIC